MTLKSHLTSIMNWIKIILFCYFDLFSIAVFLLFVVSSALTGNDEISNMADNKIIGVKVLHTFLQTKFFIGDLVFYFLYSVVIFILLMLI